MLNLYICVYGIQFKKVDFTIRQLYVNSYCSAKVHENIVELLQGVVSLHNIPKLRLYLLKRIVFLTLVLLSYLFHVTANE
jgi:hypothetical protein